MKTMTVCLFLSLIALALAIMSLYGSRIALSADSALAVVAVCTTMIVGVSVLDRMAIHDMEKRLDNLNGIEKEIEDMKINANIANHVAFGLAFFAWKPENTIKEIYKAIEIAMKADDAKRTHTCVKNLQAIINILNKRKVSNEEKEKIRDCNLDICETDLYPVFKDAIDKLYKSIEDLQTK